MADEIKLPELTAEQEEALRKKYSAPILSEDEKKAAEEAKQNSILKWGLENNLISAKEQEEYIVANATPKKEIAKKAFIEKHSELGEKAAAKFEELYRLNEDDEIPQGEGVEEKMVVNENKKVASSVVDKMADEVIATKFSRIKALPTRYEQHLAEEKIKTENTEIITKAIADIPKRLKIEDEFLTTMGIENFGVDISDDDFKEANALAHQEVLKKGLKKEDVTGSIAAFMLAKNAKRLILEAANVAYAKGRDDEKRGVKGISTEEKNKTGNPSGKRAYLQKEKMIP